MAQELDDGEFWLPSDFLTDEELLTDFNLKPMRGNDYSHGLGNSFYFNSNLSSPVESLNGSTETESDEDEFISDLTRNMVYSTLQDYKSNGWKLSSSPQSTLCGCKQWSSRGSPNSVSSISSPSDAKDMSWDWLYATAGEVSRMRMIEEATPFHPTRPLTHPSKPSPIPLSRQTQVQAQLAHLQLQVSQFQRMKEQQMIRRGVWGQAKMDSQFQNEKPQGPSPAAWPTLQQSGSGMRAVFLGSNVAKKERTGTGVFLPRRVGTNPSATRKKLGCSPVLLPDRVVHALNLNLDSIDAQGPQLRSHGNITKEYGAALRHGSSAIFAEQRGYTSQTVMNQEFRLPQEWTY